MKKRGKFLLLGIVFVLISGYFAYTVINKNLEDLNDIAVDELDLSTISDGLYRGKHSVFPVSVAVDVTVVDHRITNIKIIEHVNGQGISAESIIEDIIQYQSLNIDVISGATYSSQIIKLAVVDAFK